MNTLLDDYERWLTEVCARRSALRQAEQDYEDAAAAIKLRAVREGKNDAERRALTDHWLATEQPALRCRNIVNLRRRALDEAEVRRDVITARLRAVEWAARAALYEALAAQGYGSGTDAVEALASRRATELYGDGDLPFLP